MFPVLALQRVLYQSQFVTIHRLLPSSSACALVESAMVSRSRKSVTAVSVRMSTTPGSRSICRGLRKRISPPLAHREPGESGAVGVEDRLFQHVEGEVAGLLGERDLHPAGPGVRRHAVGHHLRVAAEVRASTGVQLDQRGLPLVGLLGDVALHVDRGALHPDPPERIMTQCGSGRLQIQRNCAENRANGRVLVSGRAAKRAVAKGIPMQIAFDVAGTPAEFRRNDVTGRTELRLGEEIVELQSPYRLSAHFAVGTEQVWTCRANDHDIQIVKVRPRVVWRSRATTRSRSRSTTRSWRRPSASSKAADAPPWRALDAAVRP